MRETERLVAERLIQLHQQLAEAVVIAPEADPPDAIVVLPSVRIGLELTDIFSVGETNERGSLFLQFESHWRALKTTILEVMVHQHGYLDQCDIYLKLDRQSRSELQLANLPRPREYAAFARELLSAIMRGRSEPFNHHSDAVTYVQIPDQPQFQTLHRYARRVEVVCRPEFTRLNVAVDVHLPVVEAGYLGTGTTSLETAILRKASPSTEQRRRIDSADVAELYLVLGGQQSGQLPHIQVLSREELKGALTFVRYPFERSSFDGIVIFDDLNDQPEVFCTKCLAADQKYNRLGVGMLDFYNAEMFVIPHACPRLAPPFAQRAVGTAERERGNRASR